MLRLLHHKLYDIWLPLPQHVFTMVCTHFPELEARGDVRKHLLYVVNQFDLNPQPKLVLFLEGETEHKAVEMIFKRYFKNHQGHYGIKIVKLGGVNNATGRKKEDRFQAIFRLLDYLHDEQTFTFLILDNENNSHKLKEVAESKPSIYGEKRLAVDKDHIYIWCKDFELDNFEDVEIATALNKISGTGNHSLFSKEEIATKELSFDKK